MMCRLWQVYDNSSSLLNEIVGIAIWLYCILTVILVAFGSLLSATDVGLWMFWFMPGCSWLCIYCVVPYCACVYSSWWVGHIGRLLALQQFFRPWRSPITRRRNICWNGTSTAVINYCLDIERRYNRGSMEWRGGALHLILCFRCHKICHFSQPHNMI